MRIPKGLVRVRRNEMTTMAREMIKRDLTVVPCTTSSFNETPDPIRLWHDDGEFVYIPRGYYNKVVKKRFDPTALIELSRGRGSLKPVDPIKLREGQPETIDEAIKILTEFEYGGAIVEAPTGSGKTVIGLEIARRLGMKVLVVVHTNPLKEQWTARIKEFMPNWSVGLIQAGTVDVQGHDVCVAMLQTMALSSLPEGLADEFGLVIFDECHLAGAQEFQKALFLLRAKYILGLSGTLSRKDKAENCFKYGIGGIAKAVSTLKVLKPTIYFVDTQYCWTDCEEAMDRERTKFLSEVIYDEARNQVIIRNAVKAARAGRHVLILSERVPHVEMLYRDLMKELDGIKVGMMIGSMKQKQREASLDSQVLLATAQLLAVGFDNPRLDTLIFATPMQNLEQAVGRILREHPEKKDPVVVDLVDTSEMARIFGFSRRKKYLAKGWKIIGDECLKNQLRRTG